MARYAIGVDLGGTNLRACAIDEQGNMLGQVSGSTPLGEGPEPVVADIADSVSQLRDRFGRDNLAGIGAGVPGFIDMKAGVIATWGNLPAFNGYPMRDELAKHIHAPVILENDANAAALGEQWMGAGRGIDDLVMLTLGTGVGGGIIAGGKIVHGYMGMAAELGHIVIHPNGNLCGCGSRGCLEKYASATAISSYALMLNLGALKSAEVYDLAVKGNDRARRIFSLVGESLGIGLTTLINTFNYPLFLIGGGVLGAWDLFAPAMFSELELRCQTYRLTQKSTPTRIEKATLGNQAGLFGAASLALFHRN